MAALLQLHVHSHAPTSAAENLLLTLWLRTLMTSHPKHRDTIFHAISLAKGCICTERIRV